MKHEFFKFLPFWANEKLPTILQLEKLKLGEAATNGTKPSQPRPKSSSPENSDFFEKLDEDARKALAREQLLESYRMHQKVEIRGRFFKNNSSGITKTGHST